MTITTSYEVHWLRPNGSVRCRSWHLRSVPITSLDDPTGDDGDTIGDLTPAADQDPARLSEVADQLRHDRARVRLALRQLPDRERRCLVREFWRGLTYAEQAERFGLTVKQVRGLRALALARLRSALEGGAS